MNERQDIEHPKPPLTNSALRTWSALSFVVALVLIVAQAFGWADPDRTVLATLLGAGVSGLGLVQARNIAELRK